MENNYSVWKICEESPCEGDVEFLKDFQLDETQSDNALKHKLVFIGGHLVHKCGDPDANCEEEISTEFLDVLNTQHVNRFNSAFCSFSIQFV